MLKELFPGSADFTVAIFKIPQISKHFSAMLLIQLIAPVQNDIGLSFTSTNITLQLSMHNKLDVGFSLVQ